MIEITDEAIEKVLRETNVMILACKAKGGWNFRKQFRCSDVELKQVLEQVENQLRWNAASLLVAETMLKEPPPSLHQRWDEYERRRREIYNSEMKKSTGTA